MSKGAFLTYLPHIAALRLPKHLMEEGGLEADEEAALARAAGKRAVSRAAAVYANHSNYRYYLILY